jgi:predicted transposase YdaD
MPKLGELPRIDPEEAKAVQKVTSEFFDLGKLEGKREGKLEGRREGKLEGKLEGRREGKLETQRKTVFNMHTKGLPLDLIASVTELSPEQVERLIAEAHRA